MNSGLRVFRRSIILQFWNLLPDGFSLTTTLTLALLTNSYRVGYIAIDYRKRVGRSKINPLKDTANFFLLILRIGLYFAPLKVFLPLSAVTVLSGIIWGVASLLIFGRLADASMMIIIMTGMQIAVVGFLAELINRRIPNPYHSENENGE